MNIVSYIDLIHLLFNREKKKKSSCRCFLLFMVSFGEYLYERTMIIVHKMCSTKVE